MAELISGQEFSESEGVEDWVVRDDVAVARFATGSFKAGADLVAAVAAAADEQDHHPDVLLTYPAVEFRLTTHDAGGLTAKDVELARAISGLARAAGVETARL